jgi:4-hydroxybenzoate polyprenyltransferase/phosphoserine phosphatase
VSDLPLVVDLDGTLILTDMLHESALASLRDRPLDLLRLPLWLASGKAVMKQRLGTHFRFDPASLPYHPEFLSWLREQRAAGRRLVLCTASDQGIASAIGDHLGLFDEVVGSDGRQNLAGRHKAVWLAQRFGEQGFDYAGNSRADLRVWGAARRAILVNTSARVASAAHRQFPVEREFAAPLRGLATLRRLLRVHQWMKNALLFVPLFAAHKFAQTDLWPGLLSAFAAFSLCASAVYVANDLLDLESDRQHPRKRLRPFASGAVPAWVGVALVPVLLAASSLLALQVRGAFPGWLLCYFLVTCAYSWVLKRMVLIDCLTLALLYTLRVIAGAAAIHNALSFWLLAFSVFLFLSLAFVKRYAELLTHLQQGRMRAHGRGYYASDAPLVQLLGVTSGYAAAVVLAMYLNSDAVVELYRVPEMVWGAVPVLLFWISWMWMQAHRGEMHDDPLVFAVKDPTSLVAGLAFAAVLVLGAVGIPW